MKKSLIQQKVIEAIEYTRNDKGHSEFGGFDNGTIKKVIIDCEFNGKHEAQGKIAFFYKNCKTFETYLGQDTRPCEIMTFDIHDGYDEDTGEIDPDWGHCRVDLHDDFNGKSHEWIDKKTERMSDRDFFEFWT